MDPFNLNDFENQVTEMEPDPNLFGRFHNRSVKKKTDDGKVLGYESEVWIEIRAKGSKNASVSHGVLKQDGTPYIHYLRDNKQPIAADEFYSRKFPKEWAAFKDHLAVDGTPLEHLPILSPSDVDNLKLMGIRSLEDLADMQESAIEKVSNGRRLKATAKAYIDAINGDLDVKVEGPAPTQETIPVPKEDQSNETLEDIANEARRLASEISDEEQNPLEKQVKKKVTKKKVTRKKVSKK